MKLNKPQLDALLAALGSDTEEVAARYVKLREKTADFFFWNRSDRPQEDADEVMDRLAKRIAEGEPVANIAAYAHKIARLILMESAGRSRREAAVHHHSVMFAPGHSQEGEGEKAFECLEPCLQKLPPDSRTLIVEYYSGTGGALIEARRQMALRLGLSANALRNRVLRLRRELEDCIARCAEDTQ